MKPFEFYLKSFFSYIVLVCFGANRIQIHVFKVDLDPGKEIKVDPDLDPEQGSKWIRIRPKVVDPDLKPWL